MIRPISRGKVVGGSKCMLVGRAALASYNRLEYCYKSRLARDTSIETLEVRPGSEQHTPWPVTFSIDLHSLQLLTRPLDENPVNNQILSKVALSTVAKDGQSIMLSVATETSQWMQPDWIA